MHDLLCRCSSILTCPLLPNPSGPSTGCDSCTATVGASVSVTFVVSFLGVLVASVICYISRRCKKSYKPSSHAEPTCIYDEVGSNKIMKGDVTEMDTNIAYGSHIMAMNTNTAYVSHIMEKDTNNAANGSPFEPI